MKLNLGVTIVPYTYPKGTSRTTGDVAEILEDRYGIMQHFVKDKRTLIADAIVANIKRELSPKVAGKPQSSEPLQKAFDKIAKEFRQYVWTRQLDGKGSGRFPIPTGAAQRGVKHLFKHPYARRGPRASFADTLLYTKSFKAWIA